jgi:hypothetical protein
VPLLPFGQPQQVPLLPFGQPQQVPLLRVLPPAPQRQAAS